jgi:NPCBM/NEW2 domain
VVIAGDGRELFRGQISRKDPPRPLALDVRGVKELRVSVTAAGLIDLGDQVDLVDAKVSK